MGRPAADEYRVRLEGKAELLETARSRYRALVEVLRARRWQEQLRHDLALLREVRAARAQVDEALDAALRRARAEGWPDRSPTVKCLQEVQALREELVQLAARRLERSTGGSLDAMLGELEDRVLTAARTVLPGERWTTALEVLPETLPAMREVAVFGRLLETLFSRSFDPAERLPFQAEEVDELRRRWHAGQAALASGWFRLASVDRTGGLVNELRKRAGRAPLQPPRNGPEWLMHAEFWRGVTRNRMQWLVQVRLSPIEPTEAERLEVAWWLCLRERDVEARLPASAVMGEARAGLLELAYEWGDALRSGLPEKGGWPQERWERLLDRARRADRSSGGADAARVRDVLRTFIQARTLGSAAQRGWQEPSSRLEALIHQAWTVAR